MAGLGQQQRKTLVFLLLWIWQTRCNHGILLLATFWQSLMFFLYNIDVPLLSSLSSSITKAIKSAQSTDFKLPSPQVFLLQSNASVASYLMTLFIHLKLHYCLYRESKVVREKMVSLSTGTEIQVPLLVLVSFQMWTVPNLWNKTKLNKIALIILTKIILTQIKPIMLS